MQPSSGTEPSTDPADASAAGPAILQQTVLGAPPCEAIQDYQRTPFGGWPWPSDAPVHPRAEGRFARHGDGRIERV